MKHINFLFAAAIFLSCSENPKELSEGQTLSLNFELDTVMVDADEDFVYLKNGLLTSDLSRDGSLLYNYNSQDNSLEVIDLNQMKLIKKIPFEIEGPHGTGRVVSFQVVNDSLFFIADWQSLGLFTIEAKRNFHVAYESLKGPDFELDEFITSAGGMNPNGERFITFYNKQGENPGIIDLDLVSGNVNKVLIPELQNLGRFASIYEDDQVVSAIGPTYFLKTTDQEVIISHSAINEIFIYSLTEQKVEKINLKSDITPNYQKDGKGRNVQSRNELMNLREERKRDVHFGVWIADNEQERFLRLSHQLVFSENNIDSYLVVLTILDNNFQVIFEGQVPLKSQPSKYFFRNGKLYVYENLNDELGFLVLTMNEN